MQVTGIVENIVARPTRVGEMFDLIVNGKKYGAGRYAPRGIQQGDYVTFEVDVKKNGQYTNYDIRRGTLRKDEEAAVAAPKTEARAAPQKTYQASGSFDDRQTVISKQAALNTALSFAQLASANGAVPMPKSVKEADKLGIIYQWVLETAAGFYKLSTGQEWSIPAAEPVVPQKPAAASKRATKQAAPVEDDEPPFEVEDDGYDEYPDEND